jgi:hypothetical protein
MHADWQQRTVAYFRRCAAMFDDDRALFLAAGATPDQVDHWRDRNVAEADRLEQCVVVVVD